MTLGHSSSEMSQSAKPSNMVRKTRRWQGGVGIAVLGIFILSSVIVNRAVQALNIASGNYGYYGGTYGFNSLYTSSDFVPSVPTSLSASNLQQTSATVSWTAPTTTTGSTSLNNLDHYQINYNTSSLSSCSGGSSTTSTSASVALSGLTANTTYYVAVCAVDANTNSSSALTGSFTTQSSGGGITTISSGGGGPTGPTYPTGPVATPTPIVTTPTVTPPSPPGIIIINAPAIASTVVADAVKLVAQLGVTRNAAAEVTNASKVTSSATEFKISVGAEVKTVAANFVTYGTSSTTQALGSGERLAVVRDLLQTLGAVVANDSNKLLLAAEQVSSGQKPTVRNLTSEQKQVPQVLSAFVKLVGRKPDFKNSNEDLAWNTLQYRIRFKRDLVKERTGITKFRALYKRTPKSPLDWSIVRAWGYALR